MWFHVVAFLVYAAPPLVPVFLCSCPGSCPACRLHARLAHKLGPGPLPWVVALVQVPCELGSRARCKVHAAKAQRGRAPAGPPAGARFVFLEGQCAPTKQAHQGIWRQKINAFQSRKKKRSLRAARRAALSPAGPPTGNELFYVIGKHLFFASRFPGRTLVQPATSPKSETFMPKLQFRGGSPCLLAAHAKLKNGTSSWWPASMCR